MNEIMKFENSNVEMITIDGEILFEVYSTGMALGYATVNNVGVTYPHKVRINKTISNAGIEPYVHGCTQYFTEDMLYNFMIMSGTKKCIEFRQWVASEVLPTLRKTGEYKLNNNANSEQLALIADKARFYEEKATFFENKARELEIFFENRTRELEQQVNELVDNMPISEMSLTIPYSAAKKNIKLFLKEFAEESIVAKCPCDTVYQSYQTVCHNRRIEPGCNRAMFDQIMHDLGHMKDGKCWQHITLHTEKIKNHK